MVRSLVPAVALACVSVVCAGADERATLGALSSAVRVEFDAYDVPLIRGSGYEDAAATLGYLHGRERFFQMDMMRRRASGRLSEIVGPETVGMDRAMRVYGFEAIAEAVLRDLPERHLAWLAAYRDGVNEALDGPLAAPLEYGLLGVEPEPWRLSDSVLVLLNMTHLLRSGEAEDLALHTLREAMPAEMVEFLSPALTRFDSPLDAPAHDPSGGYEPAPIPGPEVFSVSREPTNVESALRIDTELAVLGSNSWAVAGSRTSHGGAIVANDMHLPLMLPNIWYRAGIEWDAGDSGRRTAAGVSLPGVPGIVAGSSDALAWGFTNLTADLVDLVPLEIDAADESRYRVGDGFEAFGTRIEVIEVKGAEPQTMEVRTTRWGPVTHTSATGQSLAMRWGALDVENTNLRLLDLPLAESLEEGLEVARDWRGPAQNIVMADARGDIAWTIAGFVPDREGFGGGIDPRWADGSIGWNGNLQGDERPQIVRPESGILFTANNRVISAIGSAPYGRGFALGIRAQRIREVLVEADGWDERDVFDVAFDTRAALYEPYRAYLLKAMQGQPAGDELVDQALESVKAWDGTSDADQVGFRLLRSYRSRLHRAVLAPIVEAVEERVRADWSYTSFGADEPVLRLIEESPEHLLAAGYEDWADLQRRVFIEMVRAMGPGDDGGVATPWGERNRSRIEHPFAEMAPAPMRRLLAMPRLTQSGDTSSVLVARPTFGASERFAISPGKLGEGLIHMPAGQSGKPLSPHFRDQHGAWASGEPLSLLPDEVQRVLELRPAEESDSGE